MRDGIVDFLKQHRDETDIFCFQEADGNMPEICGETLPNYKQINSYKYVSEYDEFPQLTCIHNDINIVSSGVLFEGNMTAGLGLYVKINVTDQEITLLNFHGLSRPGDKLDSPDRLKQFRGVIDFMQRWSKIRIIGGDFNILPDTESIELFEKQNYRNLIREFNIPTTRNRIVWEKFPDNKQLHSNYAFVNKEVTIKSFSVENIEISDHLPMILEIL